jgi:hypothetical protein
MEELSPRDAARADLEKTLRSLIESREAMDRMAAEEFSHRAKTGEKREQLIGKIMAARMAVDGAIVAVSAAFAANGVRPA